MGMAGWKALPSVSLGSEGNKTGSGVKEEKKEKPANIIVAFSHGKGI